MLQDGILKLEHKLMQITLPVIKPTSCCFGTPNYNILYVTTAIFNAPQDELTQYPLSGSIFAVTELDITCLPPCTLSTSSLARLS